MTYPQLPDPYWEEQDRLRRCGRERDPEAELAREFELADRIADKESLPPWAAHALARRRGGSGPCPYERPHEPPAPTLAPGEPVVYQGEDGQGPALHGRVAEPPDQDGTVLVEFERGGRSTVAADALERRAA